MELTKPEDIKYTYCWHCIHYTGLCPHCDGNACSCFCQGDKIDKFKGLSHDEMPCQRSKYWDALKYAEENGMVPTVVTEEEINGRLDRMRAYYAEMTPEKRKENQGFGIGHGLLDESDYWQIQDKAKRINISIPTLEEFGNEVDIEPNYDCNTGSGFTEETDIPIINPLGWESQEAYETERIPWVEYCHRRDQSDCDFRQMLINRDWGKKSGWIRVGDATPGDVIRLHTGPCCYKIATVVENNGDDFVLLRVQDTDCDVSYYANNQAQFLEVEEQQKQRWNKTAESK